jgi:hypothetical protein
VTLGGVHVASRTTDESLIAFDVPDQLAKRFIMHGLADSLKQEPSGPLSDAKAKSERGNLIQIMLQISDKQMGLRRWRYVLILSQPKRYLDDR